MDQVNQTQQYQQAAGQPGGNPDTIEIEIDGKTETFTRQQLKEGIMRQQDYTKKTQELSTQKQELDRLKQRYEGFGQFEALLNNDPELAQEIATMIEDRRTKSGPQGSQFNPDFNEPSEFNEPNPIPQEVLDRIGYLEQGLARAEIRDKVSDLKNKHPNVDVDKVIDYALKNNLGANLEGAYKEMTFDEAVQEAREKGEKAGYEKFANLVSEKNLSDIQLGKGESPNLKGVQLTKEQKSYAKMLGISEDDYLKGMKKRGADELGQRAEV